MIELTRLNGNLMVVNSDLIKYVESSPDTMLTLINGEKIVVSELCQEVVERITAYRARLLKDVLMPASADGLNALAAAAKASGLRVIAAKNSEVPETDEAAQQRRRRRDPILS